MTTTTKETILNADDLRRMYLNGRFPAEQRFTFEAWGGGAWASAKDRRYALTPTNQYSSYRRNSLNIADEVGQQLEKVWKQNQYRRFVGSRTLLSILALLELDVKDVKAGRAKIEAERDALRAAERRTNARKNIRAKVEELFESIDRNREYAGVSEASALIIKNRIVAFADSLKPEE